MTTSGALQFFVAAELDCAITQSGVQLIFRSLRQSTLCGFPSGKLSTDRKNGSSAQIGGQRNLGKLETTEILKGWVLRFIGSPNEWHGVPP